MYLLLSGNDTVPFQRNVAACALQISVLNVDLDRLKICRQNRSRIDCILESAVMPLIRLKSGTKREETYCQSGE